jgi:hypothetical protein
MTGPLARLRMWSPWYLRRLLDAERHAHGWTRAQLQETEKTLRVALHLSNARKKERA